MNAEQSMCAKQCLAGAEDNSMTFPEVVGALIRAGFESYAIDFRRASATYYEPSGESLQLQTHADDLPVEAAFDPRGLQAAIQEAQTQAPGYTYRGFCRKAKAAGCVGYIVSFAGRRVLYFGRTAETHTELFPAAD